MTICLPNRPFVTAELGHIGLSRGNLRDLIASGAVRRVLHGVYASTALSDTPALRAACAALVLKPHHIVCDKAAAWIHGVDVYGPESLDVIPELEVVAVDHHDRSRRPELLGGKRDLHPEDVVTVHGLRVTSPLRTACDVACLRSRYQALACLDGFARRFALTQRDFARVLPRYRGRRGCRQLRELVPLIDARAESPGESWTRLAISDAGLPVPRPQVQVTLEDWGSVRLDGALEHLKIAVEYDGEEFHGEKHKQHDERRRQALRRAGWIVIIVTKRDFSGPRMEAWLSELRVAIRERSSARRRRYARAPRQWP